MHLGNGDMQNIRNGHMNVYYCQSVGDRVH